MAVILCHFTESGSFWSKPVKLTEDTPIILCDKMQLEDQLLLSEFHFVQTLGWNRCALYLGS